MPRYVYGRHFRSATSCMAPERHATGSRPPSPLARAAPQYNPLRWRQVACLLARPPLHAPTHADAVAAVRAYGCGMKLTLARWAPRPLRSSAQAAILDWCSCHPPQG